MRSKRSLIFAGLVCGVLVGAAAVRSATPGAVADQSYPLHAFTCAFAGWAPDDSTDVAAQTFTAAITGQLTDVVIPLRGPNQRINVAITGVDANGAPATGPPIASTAIISAPYPVSPYTDTTISFAPAAHVQAGKQYAIVLTSPIETFNYFVAWALDAGSIQTAVSGCPAGTYSGGRAWTTGSTGTALVGADADFFFQTFVIPAHRVTVQKTGSGSGSVQDGTNAIACGTTCSADIDQGQSLTLTATPDPTSTFTGWSGACSGSAATCTITVSADATVTASFAAKPAILKIKKTGAGTVTSRPAGISCGGRCRSSFPAGHIVLTARPAAGWRFARWQGGCRGTKPACSLTLAPGGSAGVTVVFARK